MAWGGFGGFNAWWAQITGVGGVDFLALTFGYCASGVVIGSNPPYAFNDFLAVYPKFFGTPATGTCTEGGVSITATLSQATNGLYTITATNSYAVGDYVALAKFTNAAAANGQVVKITAASGTTYSFQFGNATLASAADVGTSSTACNLTNCTLPTAIAVGQLVTGPGIPNNSLVLAFSGSSGAQVLTISQASTLPGAQSLNFYTAPIVPMFVLMLYINLAAASVMLARWQDTWLLGMALFVAHYCTMYLRSESGPNLNAAQIAASGLEKGIAIAKAVGSVSTSSQLLTGMEEFGSFNETIYGTQFATLGRGIGAGPLWVG